MGRRLAWVCVVVAGVACAGMARAQAYLVGAPLSGARYSHTASLLPSGKLLVAGGYSTSASAALASAELYDPATNTTSSGGTMANARYAHADAVLNSGQVLVRAD